MNVMSHYQVTIKIRNALILGALEAKGLRPGIKVAEQLGLRYQTLLDYINCKEVPFDENHNLKPSAEKLCIFFNKLPNDLWSKRQLIPLKKNVVNTVFNEESIESLISTQSNNIGLLENIIINKETEILDELISELNPKEQYVLNNLYGIDTTEKTLNEIGNNLNVSVERIRQIECKALRKIRAFTCIKKIDIFNNYIHHDVINTFENQLFSLQAICNNGKGIQVIRNICSLLKESKYSEVKFIICTQWKKIVQYPEIYKFIADSHYVYHIMTINRRETIYKRNTDEYIELYADMYDEIVIEIYRMFDYLTKECILNFANTVIQTIKSFNENKIHISVFNVTLSGIVNNEVDRNKVIVELNNILIKYDENNLIKEIRLFE